MPTGMMRQPILLVILLTAAQRTLSFASIAAPPPSRIAVAGATGKTGSLVVQELLRRNTTTAVVAMVRDLDKAQQLLSSNDKLSIVKCDLTDQVQVAEALQGVDAAIWCATGFETTAAPAPNKSGLLDKIKQLLRVAKPPAAAAPEAPKRSIDVAGIQAIVNCFTGNEPSSSVNGAGSSSSSSTQLPKIIMLSSAGVTRTIWDDETKQKFIGAADIPIVRLNPFGILDIKRESEETLRQSGVPYCIVRPCGLNDNWPAGSRPIFSQGDVACGRVNRADVASVVVDALTTPEATGKTFEMMGLAGYPKATSIAPALARLVTDKEPLSKEIVAATYAALQQLLPGEQQASANLAMGQTYEQLDRGETGRYGERGKENVQGVALQPSA